MKKLVLILMLFTFVDSFSQTSTTTNSQTTNDLKLGDDYLGGKVVYFFKPGDLNYGKFKGILVYKECFFDKQWGCLGTLITTTQNIGTASKIGSSQTNQELMISKCSNSAANFCATLDVDGNKGWILPSPQDLIEVLKGCWTINRTVYAGKYWTSVDLNSNDATILSCQIMGDRSLRPTISSHKKTLNGIIYPIKYF
jgi:hypothetical protein